MATSVEDEEYDFNDIFPTSKYYFDIETKDLNNEYISDCFDISRQIHRDGKNEFIMPCQKLIHYLKYINKYPAIDDKKKSCKYFNYKLMDELKKIRNTCEETKDCYIKMINAYSKESDGIDVCKEYIQEIHEKTLVKFQKLDSLYEIFYKFTSTQEEGENGKCDSGRECSEKYSEYITLCNQISHTGFCKALDKFRDSYNFHMKNESECVKVPRYLYSPFGTERRRTFSISLITMFATSTILFTVYKVNGILL
ncbi:hypothetical protein PVIIG_06246 [Plasmodium vivax India VII]|uniref:VIR protein n=1 Tax=Plasmodium vivax India VII TaxID=1077284 RepID=A0A0J9S2G4_PLAVI|nr:hypothetical protein PVIIG_06246 [Plasmodium vivax India VII]